MINLDLANTQISKINKDLEKLQTQVSTNKTMEYGSEDITIYDKLQKLNTNITKLEQIQKSIEFTATFDTVSEEGIITLDNYLTDLTKELSILATDGGSNDEVKSAVLEKLNRQMETIYQTGNTKLNGQYIYSGILSDIPPIRKEVDSEGKISYHYQGSTIKKDTNIDDQNRKDYGVTGQELFFDSNIFNEYIHVTRLIEEPEIVMEEMNQIEMSKGLDREGSILRDKIISTIFDPAEETLYLNAYDKYMNALNEWNENPTEENRTEALNYLNVLKGNSPTSISAAAGKTMTNDFNVSENFSSSADGTYIATISGLEDLELRLDDFGANDNIHIFKKDGTHLVGNTLSQTTIDNNVAFFDENAVYTEATNKISGVSTTTSATELNGVVEGYDISYSGSTNPGVGYNSYGVVGTGQADEVVKINGMIGEDLLLIVEGSGAFNISTEWTDYSGVSSIGLDDELQRMFDLSDIKYTSSEYLTEDPFIEYIDPETGIGTGISMKEHTMDVLEEMYDDFLTTNDQMAREEAYNLFNYTKNPFSHQMEDVKTTQDSINTTRAKLGNSMAFFQEITTRNEQVIISNTKYIDDLTAVKPEEALLELQSKTLSLQALYQAVTSIQKMSLVNYI